MNAALENTTSFTNSEPRTEWSAEAAIASLLQPDALASEQFLNTLRRKTALEPEKRLMLAMLEDAISSLQRYYDARTARNARLFQEAKDWMVQENIDWVFSFENVCEHLGLNPAYVREGLLRWIDNKSSLQSVGPSWKRKNSTGNARRKGHGHMAAYLRAEQSEQRYL
jgi:hypothetical protein